MVGTVGLAGLFYHFLSSLQRLKTAKTQNANV